MGSFSYIYINTWLYKSQKFEENKDNVLQFQWVPSHLAIFKMVAG